MPSNNNPAIYNVIKLVTNDLIELNIRLLYDYS